MAGLAEPDDFLAQLAICTAMLFLLAAASVKALWCDRTRLQNAARKMIEEVRSCASRQRAPDPVEQRVEALCSQRRLERARGSYFVFIGCGFIGEAGLLMKLLAPSDAVLPLRQMVPIQAMITIMVLLAAFPSLITAMTVHFIYLLGIALIAVAMLVGDPTAPLAQVYDSRVLASLLAWCIFDLDLRVNMVGLSFVAGVFGIINVYQIFSACAVCLMLAVALYWLEQALRAGVRHEIMAADSSNQLAAVKTLLSAICDVVVELDDALRIKQHSPRLSDVLLRNSGRSLQGATLLDFMATEEDREKFVGCLSGVDRAASHAEVFHGTVSDCNATPICMEFFSVAFAGVDAQRRHLLGMREFTDIPPLTPSPEVQQHHPPPAERAVRQSWPGTPASPEQGGLGQSAPASDLASQRSSSSSWRSALAQGPPPRRETARAAKVLTLTATLMSWHARPREASCCPFHVLLADAQGLVADMAARACRPGFCRADRWQCQRCGIVAEEHRERGRRSRLFGCGLCKEIEIAPDLNVLGGAPTGAVAL